MRRVLGVVSGVAAVACFVIGAWLMYPPMAWIVAGAALLALDWRAG